MDKVKTNTLPTILSKEKVQKLLASIVKQNKMNASDVNENFVSVTSV